MESLWSDTVLIQKTDCTLVRAARVADSNKSAGSHPLLLSLI
jgi:hypothetical protein